MEPITNKTKDILNEVKQTWEEMDDGDKVVIKLSAGCMLFMMTYVVAHDKGYQKGYKVGAVAGIWKTAEWMRKNTPVAYNIVSRINPTCAEILNLKR